MTLTFPALDNSKPIIPRHRRAIIHMLSRSAMEEGPVREGLSDPRHPGNPEPLTLNPKPVTPNTNCQFVPSVLKSAT